MKNPGTVAVFFIMIMIGYSSAAVSLEPDKGTGGKCTDSDGNLRNVGETWIHRQHCQQVSCIAEGSRVFRQVVGCGPIATATKCKLIHDVQADYPNCCPRMQC